ncbi:sigma 54-interacting transcriptional regulator [Mucilaginibacter sp. 22184]|uniref:sigma 54-interacting transcriptional regulator n=1 Tax=Mucilaginibacter sp. 22184 TaxID=3453887 RepID=UPI003F86C756
MIKDQHAPSPDDLTSDLSMSQVLLSMSNDFAATRTRDDLAEVLVDHLQALVPFDDVNITVYNKERNSHFIWAYRYYSYRLIHPDYESYIQAEFPVEDNVLNQIHDSNEPVVFDIDEMVDAGLAPPYMQYYQENGLKHFVGVAIRGKEKLIGGLYLTSTVKGNFKEEHLAIIKGVSSQLAVAITNIQANELILKHESEKSILLDLSNAIASVKSKKQLQETVKINLENKSSIQTVLVSFYDARTSNHYIFDEKPASQAELQKVVPALLPADTKFGKTINEKIIHSRGPINIPLSELLKCPEVAQLFAEELIQQGVTDITAVTMRAAGELLGCVYICSKNDPRLKDEDFSFVQGIADQLTITLVNIINGEQILDSENEKSILLTISNNMAAIRNKRDLLNTVQDRLKNLFSFSHAVTAIADEELQVYRSLVVDPVSRSKNDPDFQRIVYADYSLNHPLIKIVLRSPEPVLFKVDELVQNKDVPEWIAMNHRVGIREMVIAPLLNGKKLIGFFILFSDQVNQLREKEIRLIQGISWQLSVAVGNILANEDIVMRDEEKATLLELSKNFAVIRNKDELHNIINLKLKKVLPISHVITFNITEDNKWYTVFSLDPNSASKNHKDYAVITSSRYPVKGDLVEKIIASDRPLVFDLDQMNENGELPHYLQMNYDVGLKEAIMSPLKDGGRNNGVLIIIMNEKTRLNNNNLDLIQGVADQLSIAVANIRANEKIEQQLDEISQYRKRLEDENLYLQEEIQTTHNYSELIGNSGNIRKIFDLVSKVAESESSVLILGETGTGKELIARAIHSTSLRKDKVMIKVNCATLPANLIESELFGHERGSFTGATEKRIGKFELANNSTLFLDEVGELPLDLQIKLLRVLQEKEIERVGGRTTIKTNVRIVAATNRDLQKEVQMGNFRSDLFFRLNVFPINIPPLRERKEDISLLAAHFLVKHARNSAKAGISFSNRAMRQLLSYDWPGNVRELEHLVERSLLLSNGRAIDNVYLPGNPSEMENLPGEDKIKTLNEVERDHIIAVLKKCKGKVSGVGGAAEMLGIPATTLSSKMLRLNITKGLNNQAKEE